MKILYFTSREIWPVNTGARLRDYHLASQLATHAEVTLFGLFNPNDPKPPASSNDGLPPPEAIFERVIMASKPPGYGVGKLVRGLLGKTPVTILNCTSPEIEQALARLGREVAFDAIQMEGVHLIRYLPALRLFKGNPPVLCDWHNIESELMFRYADTASLGRKVYARRTAQSIRIAEKELLATCDAHTVCSDRERVKLTAVYPAANIHVIENGVDIAQYSDREIAAAYQRAKPNAADPARHRLLYVGSMDYHANIDAVVFFGREIWPALRKQFPDLNFTIVGRNPSEAVLALRTEAGIDVVGTVDDVRPYYREAFAAIVPLRIGGGTRLKILEALAAGVPVISTALGAEGLATTSGKEILLAGGAAEFSEAVRVLKTTDARQNLLAAGRELVAKQYDWQSLGAALFAIHASSSTGLPASD